jgi:hypothetical protein
MSESEPLARGDVIQLDPAHDTTFGGCLFIVTAVKTWGVQAVCIMPHTEGPRQAYYRAPWGRFARVGAAPWPLE